MNVSLRDYVDSRLGDAEKRWLDRFAEIRRAVDTALTQLDLRLEGMEKLRQAMSDKAELLATKKDLGKMDEEIQQLRRDKAHLDGRLAMIGSIAGAVAGLLAALVTMWLLT